MIKATIFDLNGVFIRSLKLSDRFSEKFGVPPTEFVAALKDIMPKVRVPNAGDAFSYWKPYLDKWGVGLSREEFFDFWFSGEKEDEEMVVLARELKAKGLRIFILSNNFAERANFYAKNFSFLKEISDKIYYSWKTGFVKPNIEAYRLILSENNLKPEECVYFDDVEENIKVASSLRVNSYIFKDAETTRKIIE